MRTLPRDELARRRRWQPHLLVKFEQYRLRDTPGSEFLRTLYWSTDPVTYDYGNTGTDIDFDAVVVDATSVLAGMGHVQGPFEIGGLQKTLTLRLRNGEISTATAAGSPATMRLSEFLRDQWPLQFGMIEVAEIRLDLDAGEQLPDLSALDGDEHDVWYRGELVRVADENQSEIVLEFSTSLFSRNEKSLLGPPLPGTDETTDPIDRGTRLPTLLGDVFRSSTRGFQVGGVTTLARTISPTSTALHFTDIGDFTSAARILIGREQITMFGAPLQGVNGWQVSGGAAGRGTSGTQAASHAAGETILQLPAGSSVYKWLVADHEIDSVDAIYAHSIASPDMVRVDESLFTKTYTDTTSLPAGLAGPVTTISLNRTNLLRIINDLIILGAAQTQDQQISVTTTTTITPQSSVTNDDQMPTSWHGHADMSLLIDGQTGSANTLNQVSSGSKSGTIFFPDPGGTIISQRLRVWMEDNASDYSGVGITITHGGTLVHNSHTGSSGVYNDYAPVLLSSLNSTTNRVDITMIGGVSANQMQIGEIHRSVTYIPYPPAVTSPSRVTIDIQNQAAAVGGSLRFFVNAQGGVVPALDTNYTASAGDPVYNLPDMLRWILTERMGLAHGDLDATTWSAAETELATQVLGTVLHELGETPEGIIARLCFEGRGQIALCEGASGTVWKLHVAEQSSGSVYQYPAASRTLTQWGSLTAEARDRSGLYNETTVLGDFDRTFQPGDAGGFQFAQQISEDVSAVSTYDFFPAAGALPLKGSAQFDRGTHGESLRIFGRRPRNDVFGLLTHEHAEKQGVITAARASAQRDIAGFYMNDAMRANARVFHMTDVPWVEALDLELGDMVRFIPTWQSASQPLLSLTDPGTTDHIQQVGGSIFSYTTTNTGEAQGGTSLRVQPATSGTDTSVRLPLGCDLGATDDDTGDQIDFISVDVYCPASMFAIITAVNLLFTSHESFSTDYKVAAMGVGDLVSDEWVTLTKNVAEFASPTGTWEPSKTTLVQLQVGHSASAAGAESFHWSNLRRGPTIKGRVIGATKQLGGQAARGRIDLDIAEQLV